MSSFTNYGAKATLDAVFQKNGAFGNVGTPPGGAGGMYVALATAVADAEAGSFTEAPNANAYARVQVAPADWNAATLADPSLIENANPITWAQATGDWAGGDNITHAILMDNGTIGAGNAIVVAPLTTPKAVLSGDTFSIAAGDFDFTLD